MRNVLAMVGLGLCLVGCKDDKEDAPVDAGSGSATASDGGGLKDGGSGSPGNLDAGSTNSIDASVTITKVDRSGLSDVGTAPLDYNNANLWACKPGNSPDECRDGVDLTATEILLDGGRQKVPHVATDKAEFDCFYVYPTVATTGGGNTTNFSNIAPVLDPLRAQAARFTRLCNVYAPLYRQISLTAATTDGGVPARQGDIALAVGDVLAAFDTYISKWNKGRNFVILGHSQGTGMATALLQRRIDNDPALRGKLISAVLLGGQVATPANARKGGTFQNIPTCSAPGEVGCAIAYVSYSKEVPPVPGKGLFGGESDAGVVACTEPAALAKNTSNYKGSYFAKKVSNPSFAAPGFFPAEIDTPYMLYRDYFKGTCVNKGGYSYLEVETNKAAGDTRENPPYRSPALEATGWGMHLMDYNLELEDLIEAVRLQAAAKK